VNTRPKISSQVIIKGLNEHSASLKDLGIKPDTDIDAETLVLAIFRRLSSELDKRIRVEFEMQPNQDKEAYKDASLEKGRTLRGQLDRLIEKTRWKYQIIDGGILVWEFNFS
jgi:hypothetical protein